MDEAGKINKIMEIIILVTASILTITAAVWLVNKILPRHICPICVGVSGTWILMLAGVLTGFLPLESFRLPIGVLMGGSVVGIAYQIDKLLPANRSLLWKTLFIPLGFALAQSVILGLWIWAGILLAVEVILPIFFVFWKNHRTESGKVKFLEEQMKKCC